MKTQETEMTSLAAWAKIVVPEQKKALCVTGMFFTCRVGLNVQDVYTPDRMDIPVSLSCRAV